MMKDGPYLKKTKVGGNGFEIELGLLWILLRRQNPMRAWSRSGRGKGSAWRCRRMRRSQMELGNSVVDGGVSFDKVHGVNAFEYPSLDTRFKEVFNNTMVNHTTLVIKKILKCYHGFDKLKHLVDVGGGLGVTLSIKHVGGDMFHDIPQGDAIFMKWILHDWSDDHCIKMLKNCYKALPDDGMVIVVEETLPFLSDTSTSAKSYHPYGCYHADTKSRRKGAH
ncbi:hypothetical protein L6452_15215 [Arctium lappa]|uniref:Uncharacterized protein n=1 Tax=Arctium lappa TaxID=4217 RepID=A0ACB9CN53_ARCLA|nr:hypothetical protein L6452_15215 [Arctium lappa]